MNDCFFVVFVVASVYFGDCGHHAYMMDTQHRILRMYKLCFHIFVSF